MVMDPWWIGVGVLEVKEVDELQALKPTRIKTNAPTIYKILLMNGVKQRFGKASSFLMVQTNALRVIVTLRQERMN